MLLGYAKDAPAGTYRFLHLKTKRVVVSRDVQWLGIMYEQHRKGRSTNEDSRNEKSADDDVEKENPFANNPYSPLVVDDSDNDSDIDETEVNSTKENDDDITNSEGNDAAEGATKNLPNNSPEAGAAQPTHSYGTRSRGVQFAPDVTDAQNPTVARELNWLGIIPDDSKNQTGREEQASAAVLGLFDEFVFLSTENEEMVEPRIFREAWDHPDPKQREKWRDAMQKRVPGHTKKRSLEND